MQAKFFFLFLSFRHLHIVREIAKNKFWAEEEEEEGILVLFALFPKDFSPFRWADTVVEKKSVKSAAAEGRIAIREFPEKGEGSNACNLFPPPIFDRIIEGGAFSANVTLAVLFEHFRDGKLKVIGGRKTTVSL